MAAKFCVTAALALQAPDAANMQAVRNAIVKGLGQGLSGLSRTVRVSVDRQSLAAAQRNIAQLNALLQQNVSVNQQVVTSSRAAGASLRGYLGAGLVIGLLHSATDEAIAFNSEMVKTAQVTKEGWTANRALSQSILDLGIATSTSSAELAKMYKYLISSGASARSAMDALKGLAAAAQTSTFGDLNSSIEATLALMQAFHHDGKQITADLDIMAKVSNQEAIEMSDFVTILERSGIAVKNLGGTFNDFVALSATIRSTTRENAASIGTALRSTLTFLQRSNVQKELKKLVGIDTRDLKTGLLKNPTQIFLELGKALKGISPRSQTFSNIAELFGQRNFARIVPLLTEGDKLQHIYNETLSAGGEVQRQVAIKSETLGFKFAQVREELVKLIFEVGNNKGFQSLANIVVQLTHGVVGLGNSLNGLTNVNIPAPLLALLASGGGAALLASSKGIGGRLAGGALLAGGVSSLIGQTSKSQAGQSVANAGIGFLLAHSFLPKGLGSGLGNAAFNRLSGLSQRGAIGAGLAVDLTKGAFNIGPRIGPAIGLGLAGQFAGQAGSEISQQQINRGEYRQGATTGALGGALQGGLTGAAVGFAVAGPLGAVAVGITGAGAGIVNALQDAADRIRAAKLGRVTDTLNSDLDKVTSGKAKITAENLDRIRKEANRFAFAGGSLHGRQGEFEALRGKAIGESKTFEEFQANGGNTILGLLAESAGLTAKEMKEPISSTKRAIEIQNVLTTAQEHFSSELLTTAVTVNQAHSSIDKRNREHFAIDTSAKPDFNAVDFAPQLGRHSANLKYAQNAIPSIAKGIKEQGVDKTLNGELGLTPDIHGLFAASAEQFRETAPNAKIEDILKALEHALSPIETNVHAGNAALRADRESIVNQFNLRGEAQLNADKANSAFGSSDVTRNIFGRSRSANDLSAGIADKQRQIIGLNQQTQTPEVVSARSALVNAMLRERNALDQLSSSTGNLSHRQDELDRAHARIQAEGGLQEKITFGGLEQRNELQRTIAQAEQVGAGTSINNFTDSDKQEILSLLKEFGSSTARLFGGKTGNAVIGQVIQAQTGYQAPLQLTLAQEQLNSEKERLAIVQEEARIEAARLSALQAVIQNAPPSPGHASGGMVSGPSGRDKVRANLTAGEFVIRKSAVDRIGVGTLNRMNYADGGPVDYLALGKQAREQAEAQEAHNRDLRIDAGFTEKRNADQLAERTKQARDLATRQQEQADATTKAATVSARSIAASDKAFNDSQPSATAQFRAGRYGEANVNRLKPVTDSGSPFGRSHFEQSGPYNSVFGYSHFVGASLPQNNVHGNRVVETSDASAFSGQTPAAQYASSASSKPTPSTPSGGPNPSLDISGLTTATNQLNDVFKKMDSLKVTHDVSFKPLEVLFNGASVFASITDKFADLARTLVEAKINEFIQLKLPAVGQMNYQQPSPKPGG